MPELLEIEMYRRGAAPLVGRTVASVDAGDDWYLKGTDADALTEVLVGASIEEIGRHGKLLLLETTAGTLGLRFGMTGILVIDGDPVIAELEYSSRRLDPAWNRFELHFERSGTMTMNDPRRLGGVELDPDLSRLGPDAWSVDADTLVALFARHRVAAKSLLLNQKRIAGLGNLLVDELLWRSGVAPTRQANEMPTDLVVEMARLLPGMLDEMYERGGSNCGDHFTERHAGGSCPFDGEPMSHDTVGGRSTWWCPSHQR